MIYCWRGTSSPNVSKAQARLRRSVAITLLAVILLSLLKCIYACQVCVILAWRNELHGGMLHNLFLSDQGILCQFKILQFGHHLQTYFAKRKNRPHPTQTGFLVWTRSRFGPERAQILYVSISIRYHENPTRTVDSSIQAQIKLNSVNGYSFKIKNRAVRDGHTTTNSE